MMIWKQCLKFRIERYIEGLVYEISSHISIF